MKTLNHWIRILSTCVLFCAATTYSTPMIYTLQSTFTQDMQNGGSGKQWIASFIWDSDGTGYFYKNGEKTDLTDGNAASGNYYNDYSYAKLLRLAVIDGPTEVSNGGEDILNGSYYFKEIVNLDSNSSKTGFSRFSGKLGALSFELADTSVWSTGTSVGQYIEEMTLDSSNFSFFSGGIITNIETVPLPGSLALFLAGIIALLKRKHLQGMLSK